MRAALTALALTLSTPAMAGSGDALLAKVDTALNLAQDQYNKFDVSTTGGGKAAKTMSFSVQNKGTKRLVEFHAPGDMKGTKVLTLGAQQMYVYTPAYNKVRRIASHVTEQGFMGTTLSDSDMSLTHYGEFYTADQTAETDGAWTLKLTPKAGAKVPYAAIELDVSKKLTRPTEIRYYNAKGQHVKTETRPEYECGGPNDGVCTPSLMVMTDHTRGDMATTMKMTEFKVNQGLDDSMFSVRSLQSP